MICEEYNNCDDYGKLLLLTFKNTNLKPCSVIKGNDIFEARKMVNSESYFVKKLHTVMSATKSWLEANGYKIKEE